jgi:DNA-binding protein H-NS
MSVDLSKLSVAQLKSLADEASNMIGTRHQEELKAGYAQVEQIARGLNVSVEELIAVGQKTSKKTSGAPRKAVAPRYRNTTDASETWTGRGKQPRWLAAQIAAGAQVADFLIKD